MTNITQQLNLSRSDASLSITIIIWCHRCWGVLCFHAKLHLTVQLPGRHRFSPPLDSDDRKHCCPLLLQQPRPARKPVPELQRQDVAVQGPDLQRKRLAPAESSGGSGPGQIQVLHQHHQRKQGVIYQPKSGRYIHSKYTKSWTCLCFLYVQCISKCSKCVVKLVN